MTWKSFRVFLVLVLVASGTALAAGTARADQSQTPVATACPASFEVLSVDALLEEGPYFGALRDDTAGNQNGFVCGHAFPFVVGENFCQQGLEFPFCVFAERGLPIYHFVDDANPAFQG
jgi:hypothetical protein